MIITIIIILFTLIALMALHEFGHFLLAKKFGVKVEEFGIGYPPRLFGRKIGETIYSLNLLPFGAFVKILGEDKRIEESNSFSQKPIYQRALILFAGVASFWILAVLMLTLVVGIWGVPSSIPDDFKGSFNKARVQVLALSDNSPAKEGNLEIGDTIREIKIESEKLKIDIEKMAKVQEITSKYKGNEIILSLQRGSKIFDVSLKPRTEYPEDEGPLGIALIRVADIRYPWYQAPYQAVSITINQTITIPKMLGRVLVQMIKGEKVVDVQVMGPVGIGKMLGRSLETSVGNFLSFVSMIAIWLALFNLFPIPALDGGRLLFLAIEAVRSKPMPQNIENRINFAFFVLLIGLMALVTIKDIVGLF